MNDKGCSKVNVSLQGYMFFTAEACTNAIALSPVLSGDFILNIIQYILDKIIVACSMTIQIDGLQEVLFVCEVRFHFNVNLKIFVEFVAKGDHAMIYPTRSTVSKSYLNLTAASFSEVFMPSCMSRL